MLEDGEVLNREGEVSVDSRNSKQVEDHLNVDIESRHYGLFDPRLWGGRGGTQARGVVANIATQFNPWCVSGITLKYGRVTNPLFRKRMKDERTNLVNGSTIGLQSQ
ncbi:hypothetical protein LguiA_007413 [Lonicera macranthoides]